MRNQYKHIQLEEIIEHSENMRSFILDFAFQSNPGQFAMVWLPGYDEKPISLSAKNMITVRKIGPFTQKLFEKKQADYIDMRGPYGNGFPQIDYSTIIGGGCGIAPLHSFIDAHISGLSFVLGAKNINELIL